MYLSDCFSTLSSANHVRSPIIREVLVDTARSVISSSSKFQHCPYMNTHGVRALAVVEYSVLSSRPRSSAGWTSSWQSGRESQRETSDRLCTQTSSLHSRGHFGAIHTVNWTGIAKKQRPKWGVQQQGPGPDRVEAFISQLRFNFSWRFWVLISALGTINC